MNATRKKHVKFKPIIGAWRKLSWDRARAEALYAYDRNPCEKMINDRLVGATIQDFLKEREDFNRLAPALKMAGAI
ncbi:MAG: hypothetical protein FWB80_00050 [Defluviitaleaceae bacterium]|nr:hypothetical protein [Defluviitaleaceae bacterium]